MKLTVCTSWFMPGAAATSCPVHRTSRTCQTRNCVPCAAAHAMLSHRFQRSAYHCISSVGPLTQWDAVLAVATCLQILDPSKHYNRRMNPSSCEPAWLLSQGCSYALAPFQQYIDTACLQLRWSGFQHWLPHFRPCASGHVSCTDHIRHVCYRMSVAPLFN